MKKLIILDAMGVIYKTSDDIKNLLYPYLKKIDSKITFNRINKLYLELSLGKIASKDFFSQLGFLDEFPQIETDYLDTCLELDEGFLNLAGVLSEKYDLAMLSNDASEWSAYLRRKFGLDKYFITSVISGDIGIRKPSLEIYKVLLEKAERKAHDCVFIDDNIANLSAAKACDINTIWFNRNKEEKEYNGASVYTMRELIGAINSLF